MRFNVCFHESNNNSNYYYNNNHFILADFPKCRNVTVASKTTTKRFKMSASEVQNPVAGSYGSKYEQQEPES